MKKRKIGLFSGSFNPIHNGHLILANYLCEYEGLDEIWFVVSPHNPLKSSDSLLNNEIRLRWVEQAIAPYCRFRACDIEFEMPLPSYTIDTLGALTERYPELEFTLIIGSDNWLCFEQWKDFQCIIDNYQILIYPRKGFSITEPNALPDTVRLTSAPQIEISSSFIREAKAAGKEVPFFLPAGIYEEWMEL